MKCAYCGAEFERTENRGSRKYCSRKCYFNARYHREHPKQAKRKICPTCGVEFETESGQKVYCSTKCRKRAEKKRERKEIPEIPTFLPPKVEVKPIEPPKVEPPKVIIPAAQAENRKPTTDELLDWIFSKEQPA